MSSRVNPLVDFISKGGSLSSEEGVELIRATDRSLIVEATDHHLSHQAFTDFMELQDEDTLIARRRVLLSRVF